MPILPTDPTLLPAHYTVFPDVLINWSVHNGASGVVGPAWTSVNPRLRSLHVHASMDDAVSSAEFTLARGSGETSLSPLIEAATIYRTGDRHVLDPNNTISLQISIDGSSIGTIWKGKIDYLDVAGSKGEVKVTCRDIGAYYLDAQIRQAQQHGSDAGQDIESVMEDILTQNFSASGGLYTPVSPGYAVYTYAQKEMSVLEALRQAAQQIGWDVRSMNPQQPGDLTFYDPDRARTTPDFFISASRYHEVRKLAWGDADVRNVWDLHWQDETGLPQGPVSAEDAASIARYGYRYARIFLDRADLIRSSGAAANYVAAALADSKDPLVSHAIEMPFFPTVLLNDIHQYQANGVEYDQHLLLTVVEYDHTWSAEPGTIPLTTVGARGKPIAAYGEYRLSRAPQTIACTVAPTTEYAPEGTIAVVVPSLAFPA